MTSRLRAVGAVVALVLLGLLLLWGGTGVDTVPASPASPAGSGPPTRQGAAPSSVAPSTLPPSTRATSTGVDSETGLPVVTLASLPREAHRTVELIERGGPFPYAKDGSVFGNRERLLPIRPSGWYREYTVPTPGEDDRGARRIVTGDGDRQLFWTDDHYASFARIRR
ncbi:MAG: Guanyl-specific ribonuclease [uncultured Friedmanniella sp.]|uniref:Guanyl-specific ribonuclease n=1 Tax=uncultured Friedmanniella sp. TaxID=335381 RepID=A0A6J4K089_9ACTN|nr:ribonuclease domain-containing protein [uncultured Friedmanniella sp.]CAA9292215.1 MAG: Guanyl-specific ribonuclease [uncultured Friedmanniella sp.]